MRQFSIDEDVIDLLSELAHPRQFEGMSDVLRRFLNEIKESRTSLGDVQGAESAPKGTPSSVREEDQEWGIGVPVPVQFPAARPDPQFSVPRDPEFKGLLGQCHDPPSGMGLPRNPRIRVPDRIRAPSPDPRLWVSRVPELNNLRGLTTWRAICEHLRIEVGGDSARRRLQEWVETNHPQWPKVPDA
jgi:hypothetical protein